MANISHTKGGVNMDNKICENCKHFIQHYIELEEKYTTVFCGHCIYPRIKNRKPNEKACDHYKERT